ncbi:MAG TPA: acylphosphatase [Actinomycetota bacterium]|nr:acylphosphatase [Actinomycetota bacterium]
MIRRHVFVSGNVQGVFFRAETRDRARRARVAGWVRNIPDGRVEAVFEGPQDAVDALVEWCRRGPPGADVQEVEVSEEEPEGLDAFEVRRTPR